MKLRVFTLVWGERYHNWFANAAVPSLLWPRNLEAMKANVYRWDVYTDAPQAQMDALLAPFGCPVEIHDYPRRNSSGEALQPALMDHLANCVGTGSVALLAPPDTVWGDGSVEAMIGCAANPRVCVAVPHVRVNAGGFLSDFDPAQPLTNAGLVRRSWEHLHKTWVDAEAIRQQTNSFQGGVSWRRITKDLISVGHRLPTCYLAQADESDVQWFREQHECGTWDHTWPVKLVKEQRQRVVGSSDACFMAELTAEGENQPPISPTHQEEPDKFWRDLEHNYVNRNMLSIFRMED